MNKTIKVGDIVETRLNHWRHHDIWLVVACQQKKGHWGTDIQLISLYAPNYANYEGAHYVGESWLNRNGKVLA